MRELYNAVVLAIGIVAILILALMALGLSAPERPRPPTHSYPAE